MSAPPSEYEGCADLYDELVDKDPIALRDITYKLDAERDALLLALQEAQDALRELFDAGAYVDGETALALQARWGRARERARAVLGGVDETTGD